MLVGRVLLSLACVVGILLYASRRLSGGSRARTPREAPLRVVGKQSVSRHAGVAVLAVGSRRILVGYGDQQVTMLSELAPVAEPLEAPAAVPTSGPTSKPVVRLPSPRRTSEAAAGTAASPSPVLPTGKDGTLTGALPGLARRPAGGALAGSVLDPQTWKTFVRTLQDRTVRR